MNRSLIGEQILLPKSPIIKGTPVECYDGIFVKREDLACPSPGPPFAKVRGLWLYMQKLKANGITTVAYSDTAISMAGWGVSYFAQILGMQTVVFYPVYKDGHFLETHHLHSAALGAKLEPIQAGRMAINFYKAQKILKDKYGEKAFLIPQSLVLQETIEAVAEEYAVTETDDIGSIVICVGSGTITAGVLRGMFRKKHIPLLYGVLCTSMPRLLEKRDKILLSAGLLPMYSCQNFRFFDMGFEYTYSPNIEAPFPCNRFYDRKAWYFLIKKYENLPKPVMFWNIGA